MLREPQHERKILNDIEAPPFVLSLVEGLRQTFSAARRAVFLSLFESKQRLRIPIIDFFLIRLRDVQLFHLFQGHRIKLIILPVSAMGIIRAEENLIRTHGIVDKLDKSSANRPGGVVVDLFEIFFRLSLALRIALTPVEPVEIQENHTAQVGRDELEVPVTIEHTAVDDARKRQSAVGWP